jgi:hypothetical protein
MSHDVSNVAPAIEAAAEIDAAPVIKAAAEMKSIFRPKALRSYTNREQQPASFKPVTPRSLYLLWTLLATVVALGVITWLSKIPLYTPAIAIILGADASQDKADASQNKGAHASQNESAAPATIAVIVPASQLSKLRVGQNVILKIDADHRGIAAQIFAVEPEVLSPQAAQKRFDPGVPSSRFGEPKAVALARIVPSSLPGPTASYEFLLGYAGSSIDAWVQTDSKPVLSLFPLRGRISQAADQPPTIGSPGYSGLARGSLVRRGELNEQYPLRALSCLLREKSLQTNKIKKQNEGGNLYV